MNGKYPVMDGDVNIGWVTVTRQGLYYHFCCRCKPIREEVLKLRIKNEECCQHLGVLIPVDGMFGLDVKIPTKRLGEVNWRFEVSSGENNAQTRFIPVNFDQPFGYLTMLKEAKLERQDSQIGILISAP